MQAIGKGIQSYALHCSVLISASLEVPILSKGDRKVYACVLLLLFGSVNTYTGLECSRIIPDGWNDSISFDIVAETTALLSIILADVILVCFLHGAPHCLNLPVTKVWRCYTIWTQPRIIFGIFALLFLVDAGEHFKSPIAILN